MTESPAIHRLTADLLAGSDRALARALTLVERRGEFAENLLDRLYSHTGRAHVVGITGSPGSGKSTLARALAGAARAKDISVGIIAIDPSSPFSGGAILGDRIRMQDLAVNAGVFIRSLATRGAYGGLSQATADSIDLMDAASRELILVETVGVGQDEVDVMKAVHTVVVVSVPGLGDDIQALKAGVLEIADIHVVNKADREGADAVVADLRAMLTLPYAVGQADSVLPPILECVATRGDGIAGLLDATTEHLRRLKSLGQFEVRRRLMVQARVLGIMHGVINEAAARRKDDLSDVLDRILRRELGPYAAGRALLARLPAEQATEATQRFEDG